MMDTKQFVAREHIRAAVNWADSNPNAADDQWAREATHWRVTLRYQGRQMTVPFSQGSAISREPSAADVLDCLASDASGYEQARSFEEWAADYGYDPDSRTAERTYRAIEKQTAALRRLLGSAYDRLQEADRL